MLPNERIPFTTLPIEKMIKNKLTFKTKQEKLQRNGGNSKGRAMKHRAIHNRDPEALELGIVLLDEFHFPHAVIPIT